MDALHHDDVERAQLCDLLDDIGPDAPTLLAPWTTLDLAAHLVLREHDPLAAPGLVLPGAWGRLAERRRLALRATPFTELVATVRSGPPRGFFSSGWVRRFPNLNEFFVHHEDVRRARGDGPRALPWDEEAALFRNVEDARWFLSRRVRGVGIELEWAQTGRVARGRRTRPAGHVRGSPGELLLFLFGRGEVADVQLSGSREALEALQGARFGM
jgi:uncharacterized protein (TIGR03085 family)